MNTVAVVMTAFFTVFAGGVEAKTANIPPNLAEITQFEQTILNNAKGQPLKASYGGKDATAIPQDATASASNLSCVRMPKYEAVGSSSKMWMCSYDYEIKRGTAILFKSHEKQQLSQDVRSRALEIPPPQVALPK